MTNCKTCLTIRQYISIIRHRTKEAYTNIKTDIKAYKRVNETVCELSKPAKKPFSYMGDIMYRIRKEAKENYDPTKEASSMQGKEAS